MSDEPDPSERFFNIPENKICFCCGSNTLELEKRYSVLNFGVINTTPDKKSPNYVSIRENPEKYDINNPKLTYRIKCQICEISTHGYYEFNQAIEEWKAMKLYHKNTGFTFGEKYIKI